MKRLAIAALLALALTGCGEHNTDPRKGRVVLDEEGCFVGACYTLTEICIGPDLHITYDEMGDDDYTRIEKDSPECAP